MPAAFGLSWNAQWLDSFPVPCCEKEAILKRIERFKASSSPISVELSVSLSGVKVCTTIEKRLLLCHSLRRIIGVVGRIEQCQVAYIAREPAGETYRRLCHIFKTESPHQVEEIESVLSNAYQTVVAHSSPAPFLPPKPIKLTSGKEKRSVLTNSVTPVVNSPAIKTSENTKSKSMHSTAFLSRLFGGKSRADFDIYNAENPSVKRRRRPVSAVFSQALHRFSTSSIYNKRLSTVEVSPKQNCPPCKTLVSENTKTYSALPKEIIETPKRSLRTERSAQALHFDERLSEWVYPVDDILLKQLEQVAYFFKCAQRDVIMKTLLSQPEGAFILRFSESKRRCLALSVRVPFTHNPTGVSHFLIIRNEHGFKIKGFNKYFPSIPMLITHHTVMPEQLPCRLIFADWDRMAFKEENNNYDYPPCDDDSSSNSIHS